MADVPTSLVGENGIAGRKKVITGRKKSLLGEKFIVIIMTQFFQKIKKKKSTKKFTFWGVQTSLVREKFFAGTKMYCAHNDSIATIQGRANLSCLTWSGNTIGKSHYHYIVCLINL